MAREIALTNDSRVRILSSLAAIQLLPVGQLMSFREELAELRPGGYLTEKDLEQVPICPHCGFNPSTEVTSVAASVRLDQFDKRLDEMVSRWSESLLDALVDPATQADLDLLSPEDRERIEQFTQDERLPVTVDEDFVSAVQEALSGLVGVKVSLEQLRAVLTKGGSTATPKDLRDRMDHFLIELTKGNDPEKVRIVLD